MDTHVDTVAPVSHLNRGYSNANLLELERIEKIARDHLNRMVKQARSIKENAADLVVAGVRMRLIQSKDPKAWAKFIKAHKIACKGPEQEYREIAMLIFRNFTEAEEGSLNERLVSRAQISRYGAAIAVAAKWHLTESYRLERGGDQSVAYLGDRIVEFGGVRKMIEHDPQKEVPETAAVETEQTGIAVIGAAEAQAEQVGTVINTLEMAQPAPVTEPVTADANALVPKQTKSSPKLTIIIEGIVKPTLFVVFPDGKHQVIPESESVDRAIAKFIAISKKRES